MDAGGGGGRFPSGRLGEEKRKEVQSVCRGLAMAKASYATLSLALVAAPCHLYVELQLRQCNVF